MGKNPLPIKEEILLMPKLKLWICSSLLVVVSVAPVLAGTKDAADSKAPAETTANPAAQPAAAANPNLTPVVGNANVTALLGVLVMKGVLAPSEANAIHDAAPEAEFQLLVAALARKGVVSAADLSTAVSPATAVAAAAVAPAEKASLQTTQSSAEPAKPPPPPK
jgi:hypothetical protein